MLDQLERPEIAECDTCKNKELLMQFRQDLQNNNMRINDLERNVSEISTLSNVTAEKTKVSFKLINEIKDDIKMYNGDLKLEMNRSNENLRKEFGQQHDLLKSEMNNNNNALKNDINNLNNYLNNQFINMTSSMQLMNNNITKVTDKIDKLEKKPLENWDKVKYLFGAGMIGLVFFIAQEVLKTIIHKTP